MKHILLLIFVSGLIAQDFDHPERGDERSEKMEMMMVWKLTEELSLTPEQAEKFFPRFRAHRNEMDHIRKMERALGKEMKQKVKKDDEISYKDVESTVNKMSDLRKKSIDLESKLVLDMKDILSARQLANLGMFKQEMMKNVRGELRDNHGKKGKRGKMNRRGGNKKRRGF